MTLASRLARIAGNPARIATQTAAGHEPSHTSRDIVYGFAYQDGPGVPFPATPQPVPAPRPVPPGGLLLDPHVVRDLRLLLADTVPYTTTVKIASLERIARILTDELL